MTLLASFAWAQDGGAPRLETLLRDPGAAADPALDEDGRSRLSEQAKARFDALMVPALQEIARVAGRDRRVTFADPALTSPNTGVEGRLVQQSDGRWAWEFVSRLESGELETGFFALLREDALFSFWTQVIVHPTQVWVEDELTRYVAGDGAELVTIGNSERAVLEWYEDEDNSRYGVVTWMRGADVVHLVQVRVAAPKWSDRKEHALSTARAVDAILDAAGFFEFPYGEAAAVEIDLALLDANPIYSPDGRTLPQDLKPTQLIAAEIERLGTSADGVSQLIVRAEVSEPVPVAFELEPVAEADRNAPLGSLTPLLEGRTVTLAGRHYAFALYTPPERFDPPVDVAAAPNSPLLPPGKRHESGLEIREIQVWAGVKDGGGSEFASLALARPPVVLVHGLFSDPVQTWVNTLPEGASMAALLERAGFLPFLVNYQDTNGSAPVSGERRASFLLDAKDTPYSTFNDNARVVWDSPRVDYAPIRYEYGWLEEEPILSELQKPQATRIGGISQALGFYRDELNLAATQAIVVGHSMGGVLARVWASKAYNPDYHRPENFGAGDIDRLLTLNTPHHGSELVELKDAFLEAEVAGENWLGWGRRQLANTALWWFLEPESGALRDLRPASDALARIGTTKLPAYAIATRYGEAEAGAARNDPFRMYQTLYGFAGTVFFNNRPMLDAFVLKRFGDWRGAPGDQRKATDWRGQAGFDLDRPDNLQRYRQVIGQAVDANVYHWAARREADYQDELRAAVRNTVLAQFGVAESSMGNDGELEVMSPSFLVGNALIGADVGRAFDDSRESDVPEGFHTILRNLLFHNDPDSDGAVRVASQLGDAAASEVIDNVIHSYAPWDYRVQRRVLFLLRGEAARFDEAGFPPAGRPLPRYLPSTEFSDGRVDGAEAVAWSGMVPSHAREYLRVADESDVFVLVRPVNGASTGLLACNAAAKGMNVKGKSASWGPQVGLIPFDQRYSKLWRVVRDPDRRRAEIAKYNKETAKSTTEMHPEIAGRHYAVTRPLEGVQTAQGACDVLTDPEAADVEAGVLFRCGEGFFRWQNGERGGKPAFDPAQPLQRVEVDAVMAARLAANPMLVLADDTSDLEPRPYLTADYDLLAIGFAFEAEQCEGGKAPAPGQAVPACLPAPTEGVKNADFDPLRGFIGPRQMQLVEALNAAVRDNTGYVGGYVTHHGPETQYPKSPYVDYPILVFDPMQPGLRGDGQVYLIRQGPPGFRDIHLKQLFAEKNRLGFNLWPNPTSQAWRWTERRAFDMARGYDPRDAANLPPYVAEAPRPDAETVARVKAAWSAQRADGECGQVVAAPDAATAAPASVAVQAVAVLPLAPGDLPPLPEGVALPDPAQAVPESLGFFDRMTFNAALSGQLSAQLEVADWFEYGLNVDRDEAVALGWYALAAGQGDAAAALKIARAYEFGRFGLPEEPALAARWTQAAAERGNPEAQIDLSRAYLYGHDVPQDATLALAWLTRAAEGGHDMAQFYLAEAYAGEDTDLVASDPALAISWYEKAAEQGLAPAQVALGFAYRQGELTAKDPAAARRWFERAAQQGASRAMIELGEIYRWGDGVMVDFREAERWYGKAADQGESEGFYRLGKLHEQIEFDTKSGARQSIDFLTLAAEKGHVEAAYRLGWRFDLGYDIAPDPEKAARFLTQAADQGHTEAQAALGRLYEAGRGVERDYQKAAELYAQAAMKGNARAQANLGALYRYGLGTETDHTRAASLTMQAAEQGDTIAFLQMGEFFAEGIGVAVDPLRAHMFFDLAAADGWDLAEDARQAQAAKLSPEELAEARRLAQDWRAAHP